VAAFMQAIGVERAHVMGLSLGGAAGIWLAAKYPQRVASLSLHSAWTKTDPFLKTVVESWRGLAEGLGDVTEMVITGILPWCPTPGLYATKPDYVDSLAAFVRSRPKQPLYAFMRQSAAVQAHDAEAQLSRIHAPTPIPSGAGILSARRGSSPRSGRLAAARCTSSRTARTLRSTRTFRPSTNAP
jgi:3-oxoadipate enol-lactonase